MLHRQLLSVILTDKGYAALQPAKAPFQTERSLSAAKTHHTCIRARIFPRLISAESILSGSPSPAALQPEEHGSDKGMNSRFSKFILAINDLNAVSYIKMFLMKLSKVFQI